MNLDSQIQGIWIAVGVLSGLGLILAFSRASVWQTRSGREFVDLYVSKALVLWNVIDVRCLAFEDDRQNDSLHIQHSRHDILHRSGRCVGLVVDLLQGQSTDLELKGDASCLETRCHLSCHADNGSTSVVHRSGGGGFLVENLRHSSFDLSSIDHRYLLSRLGETQRR